MKMERLIGILSILLQREKVTAPELAKQFEVRRTIQRDIESLCRAGIPISTAQGAGGGNPDEYGLLREFLYQAIYLPDGAELPPRSVVDLPELQVYLASFGTQPGAAGERVSPVVALCLKRKLGPASVRAGGISDFGGKRHRIFDAAGHYPSGATGECGYGKYNGETAEK